MNTVRRMQEEELDRQKERSGGVNLLHSFNTVFQQGRNSPEILRLLDSFNATLLSLDEATLYKLRDSFSVLLSRSLVNLPNRALDGSLSNDVFALNCAIYRIFMPTMSSLVESQGNETVELVRAILSGLYRNLLLVIETDGILTGVSADYKHFLSNVAVVVKTFS